MKPTTEDKMLMVAAVVCTLAAFGIGIAGLLGVG